LVTLLIFLLLLVLLLRFTLLPMSPSANDSPALDSSSMQQLDASALSSSSSSPSSKTWSWSDVAMGYDDHTKPHHGMTLGQMTFFLSCVIVCIIWVLRLAGYFRKNPFFFPEGGNTPTSADGSKENDVEKGLIDQSSKLDKSATEVAEAQQHQHQRANGETGCSGTSGSGGGGENASGEKSDVSKNSDVTAASKPTSSSRSNVPPVPSADAILRDVALFGGIMFYFYLCDYVKVTVV
jgi:hypothetical protein